MRFRVGLVLCLLLAYFAAGCRTAIAPNIDRNLAPETWITAAPVDTITVDKSGPNPKPTLIPVRFHVYWAGSDQDGAVAGFYWAVTETLPTPAEGFSLPPPLPGPKPQDYHFTSRSDSVFLFRVAQDVPDRQHVFYVYAVDNLGKPDPTPARFAFSCQDLFAPLPVLLETKGVGTVYQFDAGGNLVPIEREFPITDQDISTNPNLPLSLPRDTVAANSTLIFRWSSQVRSAATVVSGYRYKLEEPDLVSVPASVTQAIYHSGVGADTFPVSPGRKVFLLRVLDQALGSTDSSRRFVANFSPDTWWSGPDPNASVWHVNWRGEKYVLLSEVRPGGALAATGIPGSLMGPDSVKIMPAKRPVRRTFLEFWNDTLFCRSEFDTVHMNSYSILHSGGFDTDSPYLVKVSKNAGAIRDFPGGIVLEPFPRPTGSPIGFRMRMSVATTPNAHTYPFPQSGLYPIFDPNDPENFPAVANYFPNFQSGRAHALAIAEDGDGARDTRVTDPRVLVDVVDRCPTCGTPQERALRSKVLVYEVNRAPYFRADNPSFFPPPEQVFTSNVWPLVLPGVDDDPYTFSPPTPPGNRGSTTNLRRRIWIQGKDSSTGRDTTFTDKIVYLNQEAIPFQIQWPLAPGRCTLKVELCDCPNCEAVEGQGRCITKEIPVVYSPAGADLMLTRPGADRR